MVGTNAVLVLHWERADVSVAVVTNSPRSPPHPTHAVSVCLQHTCGAAGNQEWGGAPPSLSRTLSISLSIFLPLFVSLFLSLSLSLSLSLPFLLSRSPSASPLSD